MSERATIIDTIEDNAAFGFTGKINILTKQTGQFLGVIYQKNGFMVFAEYKGQNGQKALVKALVDLQKKSNDYKYVLEPETIEDRTDFFKLNLEDIYQEISKYLESMKEIERLKPPAHLKLVPVNSILESKVEMTPEEFDAISLMLDNSKIEDLYRLSTLDDIDMTMALISLRKKGWVRVYS